MKIDIQRVAVDSEATGLLSDSLTNNLNIKLKIITVNIPIKSPIKNSIGCSNIKFIVLFSIFIVTQNQRNQN
jgi:hypothetical protein